MCPEEFNNSVPTNVAIQSDLKPGVKQLFQGLAKRSFHFDTKGQWWKDLGEKCYKNRENVKVCTYSMIS